MRRGARAYFFYFIILVATTLSAQTLTTLYTFCSQDNCTDGYFSHAGLALVTDGDFYSTTQFGGTGGLGTIFKITPEGALTTLHNFSGPDGGSVLSALMQAGDGNFYGTTFNGGAHDDPSCDVGGPVGCGTVYRITPGGALTTLYSFCAMRACFDGENPETTLVQGKDGNLYGVAGGKVGGTIFKITLDGTLTTVYHFCSLDNCSDGAYPRDLVQGADGNFYGTTYRGGTSTACDDYWNNLFGCGTVFKVTPDGVLTTLHSFDGSDGCYPEAALVQGRDGNFYGTSSQGGTGGYCVGFISSGGTVFKITPTGTLTTLYFFCSLNNCGDGMLPYGALIQASNGNFYGTTNGGGSGLNHGTIFKITPSGALTTLYSFCSLQNCADGILPYGALVQANGGNIYGTTYAGGTQGSGTVFRLLAFADVSVTKSGNGTVTSGDGHIYCGSVCSATYDGGAQVGLTAIPAPGYTFKSWSDCDDIKGTLCLVTIDSPKNVTSTFTTSNVGLSSLVLNPSAVKGGNISIATITLNAPAPSGGLSVGVATNSPMAVHPPSVVTIPPGATSNSFPVRTSVVRTKTVANVIVSAGASQVNATLTVTTGYGSSQAPVSQLQR